MQCERCMETLKQYQSKLRRITRDNNVGVQRTRSISRSLMIDNLPLVWAASKGVLEQPDRESVDARVRH